MSDVEKINKRIREYFKSVIDKKDITDVVNYSADIQKIVDEELAKEPQECNSDLISRKKLIEDLFYSADGNRYPTRDCDNFPITISFEDLRKCINNQPQVHQWIPCSERLPNKEEYCKNDGRFIVSNGIKSYECTFDVYEEIFKQFGYNRKGIWMEYVDDKVIAWQPLPLPQPYTENRKES